MTAIPRQENVHLIQRRDCCVERIRCGGRRKYFFGENFAAKVARLIMHKKNRHPGQCLGATANHLLVSQSRFPENFLGRDAFVSLSLVLPPLPGELLMRGENGIPARIRHQITHHRRFDVNGFHFNQPRRRLSARGFFQPLLRPWVDEQKIYPFYEILNGEVYFM
jgi:hypothetical protein